MTIATELLNNQINWDNLRDSMDEEDLNRKSISLVYKVIGACDGILAMTPSEANLKKVQLNLSSLFTKMKGTRGLDRLYWPFIMNEESKQNLIDQVVEKVTSCRVKTLKYECQQLKSVQNQPYSSELAEYYFSLQRELEDQEETRRWLPDCQQPHILEQIRESRDLLLSLRDTVVQGMRNDPKYSGMLLFMNGKNIWLHDVIELCFESYTIQRTILETPPQKEQMPLIVLDLKGPSAFSEVSAFLEGRQREEFLLSREEVESFLYWIHFLQLTEEKTDAFHQILEKRLIECYDKDIEAKKLYLPTAGRYGLKKLARHILKKDFKPEPFKSCLSTQPLSQEERQKMIAHLAQLRSPKTTEVIIGEKQWALNLKSFPFLEHFLQDGVVILPDNITTEQLLMLVEYSLFNTIESLTPKRLFELLHIIPVFPEDERIKMLSWINQLIREQGQLTGGKSSYIVSNIKTADNKLKSIGLASGNLKDSDIDKVAPLLPFLNAFKIGFSELAGPSWEKLGIRAKNLTKLQIEGLSFTSNATQALGKRISGLKDLQEATISNVSYEELSDFTSLINGFKNLKGLRYLNLPVNRINREGKEHFLTLKEVLPSLTNLEGLSLTLNLVGYDVLTEIVESLSGLQNLTTLYLRQCALDNWGNKTYDYKAAGQKLMGAISKLAKLEELDLSGNFFEKESTEALIEAVNKMPNLKMLKLNSYDLESGETEDKLYSLLEKRGIATKESD